MIYFLDTNIADINNITFVNCTFIGKYGILIIKGEPTRLDGLN